MAPYLSTEQVLPLDAMRPIVDTVPEELLDIRHISAQVAMAEPQGDTSQVQVARAAAQWLSCFARSEDPALYPPFRRVCLCAW